jgi:ribose transport system ATP-binding protein
MRKSYPGVVALDEVDFMLNQNEIVGLIGENGAGKSTLMKILIGLIQPDAGSYKLRGAPVTLRDPADAARHGVGMVFQEGSLVPNLSIMENLFLCHEIGFRKFGFLLQRAMRETASSILSLVKVTNNLDIPISETTPAVRQMVEIAGLLWLSKLYHQENPVLVLDEPTTVLTEDERKTLFAILNELKSQASIILISHRLQVKLSVWSGWSAPAKKRFADVSMASTNQIVARYRSAGSSWFRALLAKPSVPESATFQSIAEARIWRWE